MPANYAPKQLVPFAIYAAALLVRCEAASPPLPPAEQAVIEAFLRNEWRAYEIRQGIRENALLEDASGVGLNQKGEYLGLQKNLDWEMPNLGLAFQQAKEDFFKKLQTSARIGAVSEGLGTLHFISHDTFQKLFANDEETLDEWMRFSERFPNCGRVLTLSRVGLDSTGTFAILSYSRRELNQPIIPRFEIFHRKTNVWKLTEYRKPQGEGPNAIPVSCELRYFVEHDRRTQWDLSLQAVQDRGTNLLRIISPGYRLAKNVEGPGIAGWVLQVTEPAEYAGQILTAVPNDFPKSTEFDFEGCYDTAVPKSLFGDLNFRLRF